MFCNATLHPAYTRVFFLSRAEIDEVSKEKLLDIAFANINKLWVEIEARLENNQYLGGNEITAGDILLTVIANWSARFPKIKIGNRAKQLFAKVISRPAYKNVLELECIEYKVANLTEISATCQMPEDDSAPVVCAIK